MLGEAYVHYSNTGSMDDRYGTFGFIAGERIYREKVRAPKKCAKKKCGTYKKQIN
jgi:hypothetical protein